MILFISNDGLTDQVGTSQILPYLEGLSNHGYEIHIISLEKARTFQAYKSEIIDRIKVADIGWTALQFTKSPPILSTVLDIWKMRNQVRKLIKNKNVSIIHARCYIPSLIGEVGFKNTNQKFIFDMRGFWADERRDGNLWKKGNGLFDAIFNFFKKKEKEWLLKADHIVSLTKAAQPLMQDMVQNSIDLSQKTSIIPCCVDMQKFDPSLYNKEVERNHLLQRFGWNPEAQILVYLGALGTWYEADKMMQSFQILKQSNPNLKMLWITREPQEIIDQEASKLNISSSDYAITSAASSEVPQLLSACDIGIFYIKPAFSKQASSPIKQGEYWAMGLPVIANSGIGDSDYIINKYKSGISISSPEDLSGIDINTLTLPSSYREECAEYFGLENGINSYAEIYHKLLT